MVPIAWAISLSVVLQVPPPETGPALAVELKAARRAIEAREVKALEKLTASLSSDLAAQARSEVLRLLPRAMPRDGAIRVKPLPELVLPQGRGLASVSSGTGKPIRKESGRTLLEEVQKICLKTASELYELATRAAAARPPEYAHAAACLREVLQHQPDHSERAGYWGLYHTRGAGPGRSLSASSKRATSIIPSSGGFRLIGSSTSTGASYPRTLSADRRFAGCRQRRPIGSGQPGKIPGKSPRSTSRSRAMSPSAKPSSSRRRLEAFYDVFFMLLADLVGDNLPLARRFRSPSLTGEMSYRPHQVFYFSTKDEYVRHLAPSTGDDIDQSLGYYNPPRPGKGNRAIAYFFRDVNGQLPVTATLYHEVSHQLLFETAGPNAFTKNVGGYWVFEGLGTYFETVTPQPDGTLEVGGLVGERLAAAQQSLSEGRFLPLEQFVMLDQNAFNRRDRVHANYQQAMALAVFLMQWSDGVYRDAFLDFVRDAYRGRIKRGTGRSLEDRLGVPLRVIDTQSRDFLAKAGQIR